MKTFRFCDAPVRLFGVRRNAEGRFIRLDEEVAAATSELVRERNYLAVGGRVRFKTDSPTLTVRYTLASNRADWAIPLPGSAGVDVYAGTGEASRWVGYAVPYNYTDLTAENRLFKGEGLETVTINLPRNEPLLDLTVTVEDGAEFLEPDEYTYKTPIVFYGSSITEGGCATAPGNAYTSMVSRALDSDYINLGFSGGAHGEQPIAEYISRLEMSVFVMDYDHNANDADELERTHERFFKTVRAAQPELPVIFMTKPDFTGDPTANSVRRDIIGRTYENALEAGDRNVWFIDGESYFEGYDRGVCTVEGLHPNDLGFMLMAKKVLPVLREALAKGYGNSK